MARAPKPKQAPIAPQAGVPGHPDAETSAWLSAIERAQRDLNDYMDRCDRIQDRYTYEAARKRTSKRQFQMLWSNIEVLKPATYAKPPKPQVDDRWKTGNPVTSTAAQLIERNLIFQNDVMKWGDTFTKVRDEFLLFGRGVPRMVYQPVIEVAEVQTGLGDPANTNEAAANALQGAEEELAEPAIDNPDQGDATSEVSDEPVPPSEVLKLENIRWMYVHRRDFIHPKVRMWDELPWLDFRSFLTRSELIARFGKERGEAIPLNAQATKIRTSRSAAQGRDESLQDKAVIHEIWDKANNEVLWVAEGYHEVIERCPPYLKFSGFWPCPKPAYGTLTTDTLIPTPDFVFYQDQAEEIDQLTARIGSLTDSLKLVGFYPADPTAAPQPEIELAIKPGFENKMIAVKSWAAFKDGGGAKGHIEWLPVEVVATILRECIEVRKQIVEDVYAITGISDIMRGDTEASETATAQKMKGQFGSARMRDRQMAVANLCAECCSMAAEVMCATFQIQTMLSVADMMLATKAQVAQAQLKAQLAQQQWQKANLQNTQQGLPPPPAPPEVPDFGPTVEDIEAFLRNDAAVKTRVDIEVDSTINADEEAEKASRSEFLTASSQFVGAWGPMIQASPDLAPLAGELFLFGVRAFRTARSLEGVIEQWVKGMQQKAAQPQQPQTDPVEQEKLKQLQVAGQNAEARHKQESEQSAQKHSEEMEQTRLQHAAKMDEIRTQGAIAVAKEHVGAKREAQGHEQSMEGARVQRAGEHLKLGLSQRAADADESRKHSSADRDERRKQASADAEETRRRDGAIADGSRTNALAIADNRRKEEGAKADEGRKARAEKREAAQASEKEQTPAIMSLAEELIKQLKANGEQSGAAFKELAKLLQTPKRVKVTGRGPDGRVSDAEIG